MISMDIVLLSFLTHPKHYILNMYQLWGPDGLPKETIFEQKGSVWRGEDPTYNASKDRVFEKNEKNLGDTTLA